MHTFSLLTSDGKARRGRFETPHGTFETPQFMPVGTRASVRGVDVQRLKEAGAQITLVNTYHLSLRPGAEIIRDCGGIQRFSGWTGPILSDSGGYQVFSLKHIRKLDERGVEFKSHLDGSAQFISPERSIEIQETLRVDIAMAFDECPAPGLSHDEVATSLELTLRWAERCLKARRRAETALFGITQGGIFPDLRARAAEAISAMPFDGCAIGGVSVGERQELIYEVLSYHPSQLPSHKIRYLMGMGTPQDIVEAVSQGIDLFDCVMPTRAGRFGRAFVSGPEPFVNLRNSRFIRDTNPLDPHCPCIACRSYSRAYLCHLFRVDEMLGPQLVSVHNLTHYLALMARIREAIEKGTFGALYRDVMEKWRNLPRA